MTRSEPVARTLGSKKSARPSSSSLLVKASGLISDRGIEDLRRVARDKLGDNQDRREAMLSLIASGEAIAFVGAGLSADPELKYPSWPKLLETLCIEARKLAPFSPSAGVTYDALLYAEEIKQHFKKHDALQQLKSILGREYAPRDNVNCTLTHRRLVKLPFRAFATTNYDGCLEQALSEHSVSRNEKLRSDLCVILKANGEDRHMVSRFLRSIVDPRGIQRRCVAHIHGWYDDAENIILAASDYATAYGFAMEKGRISRINPVSTMHRQFVWSLFATRRLVFFGCSMDDPYLKALLDAVTADLWEWNQTIHFVVLPIDKDSLASVDSRVADFRRHGLEAVFFDNWDGRYVGLDQLLEEAAGVQRGEAGAGQLLDSTKPDRGGGDQAGAARASSEIPKQNVAAGIRWLEEVNNITIPSLKRDED